jgi:glutamate-1-semialdehyde 2,1-aminomutase
MTAGIETLKGIQEPGVWEQLEATGARLMAGLETAARQAGVSLTMNRVGTMFGLFFNDGPVTDWDSAAASDLGQFARYFQAMLQEGVYVAPSQFEAGFLSTAHGEAEIEATVQAAAKAFTAVAA